MKTPSQIIRERIGEEKNKMFLAYCGNPAVIESRAITWLLHELLPLIEEYEANSVEKLLEEIGKRDWELILRIYPSDKEWVARYYPTRPEINLIESPTNGFWTTPQEALQKLRDKLNNQK